MTESPLRYFDPAVNRFQKWAGRSISGLDLVPDLLPIIPPGAPISAEAGPAITADKLGKIPGLRLDDGWIGFKGWPNANVSRETLVTWHDKMSCDQYGIGLNSRRINALDVDTKQENFAQWAFAEACSTMFCSMPAFLIRVGRPPSFLVPFVPVEGGDLRKDRQVMVGKDGEPNVIEWLGVGQQFVVEGVHPKTLAPYTWHLVRPGRSLGEIMEEHDSRIAGWFQ